MQIELLRCVEALPRAYQRLTWTQPDEQVAAAWSATQQSLSPAGWSAIENGWAHASCWLTVQPVDGGWFWLLSTLEGL